MRYKPFHDRLTNTVLNTPGDTSGALRRAVLERATHRTSGGLSPELTHYVDTVAQYAYKVRDADVAALQQAGHSDDAVFEITVAAAVGAALHRLERGLAALRGEESD